MKIVTEKKQVAPKTLKENVVEYFKENNIKKAAEKVVKKIGPLIKEQLELGQKINYKEENIQVHFQRKESSMMDTMKLIEKLKELGKKQPELLEAISEVVTTTEVVDEDMVGNFLANGLIPTEVLTDCIVVRTSGALLIKEFEKRGR